MDYLDEEAQVQLLERLLRGTRSEAYVWKTVRESEYDFGLRTGRFAFTIESRDGDDVAPFILSVYEVREEGDRLKTLQQVETASGLPDISLMLEDLYEGVKRKVLRLDTFAEEIFEELDLVEARDDGVRADVDREYPRS